MLRWLFMPLLFIGICFGLSFLTLEGKSVAAHLLDIWRSPVVQEKARLVRQALADQFESDVPPAPARKAAAPTTRPIKKPAPSDEHTDGDRKALDALVHRVQKAR